MGVGETGTCVDTGSRVGDSVGVGVKVSRGIYWLGKYANCEANSKTAKPHSPIRNKQCFSFIMIVPLKWQANVA